MKLLFIFLFLNFKKVFVNTDEKNYLAVHGISQILRYHYEKNSINFDIIVFGRLSKEVLKLHDMVNNLIRTNKESISGKIIHLDENSSKVQFTITQSAILFFDSTFSFNNFNEKVLLANQYTKPLTFLAYFETYSFSQIRKVEIFATFQFNLFFDFDESFCLAKSIRYKPNLCKQPKFEKINRFSPKTLKWEKSISLDHETKDFHGCEVNIGITSLSKPSTYYKVNHNGTYEFFGFTVALMDTLAQHFNFTVVYSPFDILSGNYLNKTFEPDFGPQISSLLVILSTNFRWTVSQTFIELSFGIIIPHGELYTPLEKLFLPFDLDTWIIFAVYMIVGIIVIEIFRRTSKNIQNFVFGDNITSPKVNLFQAFFGISLSTLPIRTFARYLLMVFIMFCLVMRTAYQGKMFQFLQKDVRKPEVKSIDEMIDNNFTFFCMEDDLSLFENMDLFQRLIILFF